MDRLAAFEAQRPLLLGIGYRILGAVADAEDVVQEAWLRWSGVDLAEVRNAEAFLTTVVTRLALDRLRRVKARREVYPGSWLPEPVALARVTVDGDADEEPTAAELADSLSMALLVVLETLSPLERAAFVLREVFDRPYADVAAVLGRTEPAVRQLVHRARDRVRAGRPRYETDQATHADVARRFGAACVDADIAALLDVLAPDVVVLSDGGGVAQAPRRPVHGRAKVARLLAGISGRVPAGVEISYEAINGRLGAVARLGGAALSAVSLTVVDGRVQTVHLIANPAKLAALDRTVHLR